MQIKLIPASSLPTVLFTVTYSEPPDYLGFPASWAQALHRLSADDLELPGTVHAFDKTTWLVAILHSVTFDLARRCVVCTYMDGRTQVWPLDEEVEGGEKGKCLLELESVLRDVNQSAVEAEREKRRLEVAQAAQRALMAAAASGQSTAEAGVYAAQAQGAANANVVGSSKHGKEKDGKHKKQRSLLMSLVASLVNPKHGHPTPGTTSAPQSSPLSPLPAGAAAPASPAPSQATISEEAEDDVERMSSTALRRRARSTLVNAFRRHVLMRLSACAQPGGYTAWIARSMLARVEGEMAQMVRDAGGAPDMDPSMGFYYGKPAEMGMARNATVSDSGATRGTDSVAGSDVEAGPTLVDEPPPFCEEEDADADGDRDSASTDTDGSSVHTPDSVSFDNSPFFAPPRSSSPPPSPPASPTPPPLSPSHKRSPPSHPVSPSKPKLRRQTMFVPHTSPPPSPPATRMRHALPNFTQADLAAYTSLSGQRLRLQSVLTRIEAQLAMQAQDERQLQSVLEIKSRRRAWSNHQYMGKAYAKDMGLCLPARSSPLARFAPINASDLEAARPPPPGSFEAVPGKTKRGLVVTTAEHNIMRLFPVCEEEEEEEDPAPPYDAAIPIPGEPPNLNEKDEVKLLSPTMQTVRLVEDRGLPDADVVLPLSTLQLQRHAVPIRPRARSILHADAPPPSETCTTHATHDDEKHGGGMLEPQTKVELFDVYHSEEEDEDEPALGDVSIAFDNCGGKHSEYTLGMDIPETFGVPIDGPRYDHEEWISVANASITTR